MSLLLAILCHGSLIYFFRRFHSGLTDIFSVNALYIAFGSAGLFDYYLAEGHGVSLILLAMLGLWLIGMWVGANARIGIVDRCRPSRSGSRARSYDMAAIAMAGFVYAAYIYSILSDGLLLQGGVDLTNRFLLVQENKVQAYFLGAVAFAPAVILFRINSRLALTQVAFRLLPFGLVQAATLSKTGMISLLMSVLIYYGLQVRFGCRPPPGIRRQVTVIVLVGLGVLSIFWGVLTFLTAFDDVSVLGFVTTRLMRSFDSLIYLSDMSVDKAQGISIVQWYLAPFLKVLGLFDQYYNGFNYFIAIEYFGFTGDSTPLLPNNTQVGELYVAFPLIVSPLLALVYGAGYGLLYARACRYIARGGPLVLSAAFVVSTPFGFLVDGQGYFIALICSLILSGVAYLGAACATSVRRSVRSRHRTLEFAHSP